MAQVHIEAGTPVPGWEKYEVAATGDFDSTKLVPVRVRAGHPHAGRIEASFPAYFLAGLPAPESSE